MARAEKLAAQQLPWIPDVEPGTALVLGKDLTGAVASSAYLFAPGQQPGRNSLNDALAVARTTSARAQGITAVRRPSPQSGETLNTCVANPGIGPLNGLKHLPLPFIQSGGCGRQPSDVELMAKRKRTPCAPSQHWRA